MCTKYEVRMPSNAKVIKVSLQNKRLATGRPQSKPDFVLNRFLRRLTKPEEFQVIKARTDVI